MATIRVTLSTLDGQPLGFFEVSRDQKYGCLTVDDEQGIIANILFGLDQAQAQEPEEPTK